MDNYLYKILGMEKFDFLSGKPGKVRVFLNTKRVATLVI